MAVDVRVGIAVGDTEGGAVAAFPFAHGRKTWSTNPPSAHRPRRDGSTEAAVLRLAGAVLLGVHDEWAIAERRSLAEGSMALLDHSGDDDPTKEVDGGKSLLLAS